MTTSFDAQIQIGVCFGTKIESLAKLLFFVQKPVNFTEKLPFFIVLTK